MSKKVDLMTPEERAKKYGNEIKGVGIIYLVLYVLSLVLSVILYSRELKISPVNAIISGVTVVMLIFMIIGGHKRNKTGVIAALAFEIYMIVSSILSILLGIGGPDLVGLIVMICIPFDIKGLSKAIKDMENSDSSQNVDNSQL